MGTALKPGKAFNPAGTGTSGYAVRFDDARLASAGVAPQSSPGPIGATTNLTAVPGSFADLAAVQTYLAGANVVPRIESRLDAIEAKVDAIIAKLVSAGVLT